MSKHTPGPWSQGWSEVGINCVWLNGLSEPLNEMGDRNTWIECVTKSNARLIASAPELYALAERIARLNKDAGEIGAGMLAGLVDEATRIIEKVEK